MGLADIDILLKRLQVLTHKWKYQMAVAMKQIKVVLTWVSYLLYLIRGMLFKYVAGSVILVIKSFQKKGETGRRRKKGEKSQEERKME